MLQYPAIQHQRFSIQGHLNNCRNKKQGVDRPANTTLTLEPEHPDATRDLDNTPHGMPMDEGLTSGTALMTAQGDPDWPFVEEDMQVDDEDPLEMSRDDEDSLEVSGDEEDEDYREHTDHDSEEDHPLEPVCVPMSLWSSDMVQTEEMGRVGICISTVARVVVCIACRSAVKPSDLQEHMRKTHSPIQVTDSFCQDLRTAYSLCENPINSRPGTIINAIYGLDLKAGLFACNTCGYAFRTSTRVKSHVKNTEGCKSFQKHHAQTFQSTSNRCYFAVKLPNEP